MYGPFGFGFHALIVVAIVVFWLVVVGGILFALYFVVRTAVTRGILRADDIRSGAVADPRYPARRVPPPAPREDQPRPEPPRTDPAPPDVAA